MNPYPDDTNGAPGEDVDPAAVWRYPEMCEHWNVSRATIERWVRRYEQDGDGIPVHRDPSGRPYWLVHEAAASAITEPAARAPRTPVFGSDRLERLRHAARRGHRVA